MNPSRLRIAIVFLIVSSFACNFPSQVTPTPAPTLIADYGDAPDPNFPHCSPRAARTRSTSLNSGWATRKNPAPPLNPTPRSWIATNSTTV